MSHSYRLLPGVLLLAWLPLAARAQTNFQPGYVVRPAGDTLRGEVDLRDAAFSAAQCRFRPTAGAEPTLYRPAELQAYGVPAETRHYRSRTLPGATAPVFAQVLESGPATLYGWRDADQAEHYYLEAPQFALAELRRQRLLLPGGGSDATNYRDQPVYRLTLAQALPNCPAAERQLSQLPLSAPALARVVRAFNECRGVKPVAPPRPANSRPRFAVLLGVQRIDMRFTYPSSAASGTITQDVPAVTYPLLGVGLGVPLSAFSRKLSLELGLTYSHQRYNLATSNPGSFGYQRREFDFTLGFLRLPVLLRFSPLPQARVRPVLEGGVSLAYATTLDATIVSTDNSQRVTTQPFYLYAQHRLQEGVVLGAGLQGSYRQGRRATALLRFEAENGWTNGNDVATYANRYYLLLALDLTK